MTHKDEDDKGSNFMSHCLATETLSVVLALAFFGDGLEFVDGVEPPLQTSADIAAGKTTFDVVTKSWVKPSAKLTYERARRFYGDQ